MEYSTPTGKPPVDAFLASLTLEYADWIFFWSKPTSTWPSEPVVPCWMALRNTIGHWWKIFKLLTPWTTESTVLQRPVRDRHIDANATRERAAMAATDIVHFYSRDRSSGFALLEGNRQQNFIVEYLGHRAS